MTVLVYGLGRSGLAVLRLLVRQGHPVEFFEQRADGPDVSEALNLGARRLKNVAESDASVVIAAPGVPIDHPDLLALSRRGLEITGEVGWVHRTVKAPLVGVTGTAGKGTVTAWVTHVLQGAGIDAVAGGNIDPALAEVARTDTVLVTELSSFQLERSTSLDARVAVILNLGSDHLDRHGSVSAYHAAKRNLLQHQQQGNLLIINADDPILRAWRSSHHARTAGFSLTGPAEAWLDGEQLLLHGQPLVRTGSLKLRGPHNVANALATALACHELGVTAADIARHLVSFTGLPGRFSTVAEFDGLTFIEDSIATRPLAVRAALEASSPPLVWIAGGRNKGALMSEFRELAQERVSLFIGIGEAGAGFCSELEAHVPVLHVPDASGRQALRRAVRAAAQHLTGNSHRGGTVLLAPLATSFDQFADYRERGKVFREEVRLLEESWIPSY